MQSLSIAPWSAARSLSSPEPRSSTAISGLSHLAHGPAASPRYVDRAEQRTHATLVIRGLLSGRQRKTCGPIAVEAGVHRKPVQDFVAAGGWDDEAVMAELRGHVREVPADPQAVLILDPSGFPKSGGESCGVARQWCGLDAMPQLFGLVGDHPGRPKMQLVPVGGGQRRVDGLADERSGEGERVEASSGGRAEKPGRARLVEPAPGARHQR